jgi:hypothetical protein
MFTSNFANLKRLTTELRPVAICLGQPRWYHGAVELRLSPRDRATLKLPREEFDATFAGFLAELDAGKMWHELGDNAVLLCWEPPNTYCHRRAVAEWFERELGHVVPEFGFVREQILRYQDLPWSPKARKPRKETQATLFE